MRVSVVIPTWRRAVWLRRCLDALALQARPADEVIVVAGPYDDETADVVAECSTRIAGLRLERAAVRGQVASLNVGIAAATGDVVAITDDDAAPRAQWLALIVRHMESQARPAGVGGRDWIAGASPVEGGRTDVGRVQWFGRVVGNHHLGSGPAREVDVLKGANMSYRAEAIAGIVFDERLRGIGAQPHNDLAFSLAVRRAGGTLIYDPEVAVDHHRAPREDDPRSSALPPPAIAISVHNYTVALLDFLSPARRMAFLAWATLVGSSAAPGALQAIRLLARDRRNPGPAVLATWRGLGAGTRTWRSSR